MKIEKNLESVLMDFLLMGLAASCTSRGEYTPLANGKGDSVMNKFVETNNKIEKTVVSGYKSIENGVVSGYKLIENGVVSGYKTIEKRFVKTFLTPAPEQK